MAALLSTTLVWSRLTRWELAVLSVETCFHTQVHEQVYTTLQNGVADAWMRATGFAMPAEVSAYVTTFAPSVKKAAKAAACVFHACETLNARPVYKQELLQRVRALASAVSPEYVQCLARGCGSEPAPSFLNTWLKLQQDEALDRPARAAVACLLCVMPRSFELPPIVGDLTPEPVTWDDVPALSQVLTDTPMPVLPHGDEYAALCHSVVTGSTIIHVLHAGTGHMRAVAVDAERAHKPVWLARAKQCFVVGCTDCVLRQVPAPNKEVQWLVDVHDPGAAPLPARNHLVKVKDYIIWQAAGTREVRGMRVDGMYVVEDSEEELGELISAKQRPVAARGSTVFSDGQPLFQLPVAAQQTIAAVHAPSAEYVDAFTTVGDWWRVHLPTLTAYVVGLDLQSLGIIDVLCVY